MEVPIWALNLDPWLDLAAFVVCLYFSRVSRRMIWLVLGYGLFCAVSLIVQVLGWVGISRMATMGEIWVIFDWIAPLDEVGWACLVIGLYSVLSDLSGRLGGRAGDTDPGGGDLTGGHPDE